MKSRHPRLVIVMFVVGIAISVGAADYVFEVQRKNGHEQLTARTRAAAQAIQFSFQNNLNHVTALQAFFDTNSRINRSQFSRFAADLMEGTNGLQALEWIPRVRREQRQTFESTMQFDGFTDFRFRQAGPDGQLIPATGRAEYYPVYFVEPFPENYLAFGFDLASSPARLTALQAARDSGEAVVSQRISMIQDKGGQFGVLLFKPVYRRDLPHGTPAERQAAIRGMALGVLRISDIVNASFSSVSLPDHMSIEIFDNRAVLGQQLLFSSRQFAGNASSVPSGKPSVSPYSYKMALPVRNLDWQVVFFDDRKVGFTDYWVVWLVFGAGLAITGLVGSVTGSSVSRAREASLLVADRTSQLKATEDRMRGAIEALADGFAIYDHEDRLVLCNRKYREIYAGIGDLLVEGAKFGEILLAGAERGQFPDAQEDISGWVDKRVRQHQEPQGPFEQRLANGHWLRIEERRTDDGGYVGIRTDITGLKEKEFALLDSERRAQQIAQEAENARSEAEMANLAKSNFLATMSHEIRTPMNGVLGLAQLLKDSPLNEDQQRKVDTILSSGRTLLSIINDVLDMSRIEAGGVELEMTTFSLPDLIAVIATPFQSLADDKGLRLHVNKNIPSSAVFIGDPARLRQILWNLLSNAIKFTNEGSVNLTILEHRGPSEHVGTRKDHTIKFRVEDTGIGISPERLEMIFDPFTQEDSSISRKYGGSGLGLAIVKRLAGLMDGGIDVVSEHGKGTRFDVYIPFHLASDEETRNMVRPIARNGTASVRSLDILVAEDNLVNAMVVEAFLNKFGHRVRHVENGLEAVREFETSRPDLVFMDIHMPEMNGIEATRAIRAATGGQQVPIIGLTAEAFTERHVQFREAGMNDVLTKPFTEEQLYATVATHSEVGSPAPTPDLALNPDGAAGKGAMPAAGIEPSPATVALPIGDLTALNGFRDVVSAEKANEIIARAPESIASRLEELRRGLELSDSRMVANAAHAIKGVSGSLFAVRLSDQARQIEDDAEDLDRVRLLFPEFEQTALDTAAWWTEVTS